MGKKSAAAPAPPTRKPKHNEHDTPTTSSTGFTGAPVLFWKEDEANGFLCQWYRCTFTDPDHAGVTFSSAEQYMMWRKAIVSPAAFQSRRHSANSCVQLFNDQAIAAKILSISSPRKQKGLAREIANFDEARWVQARLAIVRRGNWLKFTPCTNVTSMRMEDRGEPVPLRELLLATQDRELAQASPFDALWGIGLKAEEAVTVSSVRWGENLLEKALMHVRSELREAATVQS